MALLIYTKLITNRKKYVFAHIFKNILGLDVDVSDDEERFNQHNGAKISYAPEALNNEIWFEETALLSEDKIQQQDFEFSEYEGFKIPFKIKSNHFNFDVFAASFYFLSRYEEYVDECRDEHNRFEGKSALAFKNGFIRRPLIDEWAYKIVEFIQTRFPEFKAQKRNFTYLPTLDIDRPFYYKTDAFLKRTVKMVLLKFKKDPFDIYEEVKVWDDKFGLKTTFFFLMGNKHPNDIAPNSKNKLFQTVIKKVTKNHKIGIHPSYFSNSNPPEIGQEKSALAKIVNAKIEISRQHYLMLDLPKTYRNLITEGVKEDYTLAFADVAGFRTSTCTPFFWYDLERGKITNLKLFPTAVMDQTLRRYMNLSPGKATEVIFELIENTKKVNGTFISLWHNESINDFKVWKGWKEVYVRMLEEASGIKSN